VAATYWVFMTLRHSGLCPYQTGLNATISKNFNCMNHMEKGNRFYAPTLRSSSHFSPTVHP